MSSDLPSDPSRRGALKCLAFGGVGTVFVLAGGILTPVELALAATAKDSSVASGVPLFLQISDSHIGFNKEANPDVAGTLKQTIDFVNAMPVKPALTIHTGDPSDRVEGGGQYHLPYSALDGVSPTDGRQWPRPHAAEGGE
jgi:hypothetical protein